MKVLVLGAGVIGVTTAWYLARSGCEVTVIERREDAAQETSFANGGQISVSHAEPWANPTAPLQALRWLGKADAPLLFHLRADAALLRWTLAFLRQCTPQRRRHNLRHIVALANDSREHLRQLRTGLAARGTPLDYQQRECGILHLYTDARLFAAAQKTIATLREAGCERQLVSAERCCQLEPALTAIRDQIVGADFCASDESGDAHLFTRALAAHCARLGVQFRYRTSVAALLREGDAVCGIATDSGEQLRADATVVALGSYSPLLLRPLGMRLPVYPAKGYSATWTLADNSVAPTLSLIDDQYKLVFSRLGERLRVAGSVEFGGYDLRLAPSRSALLLRRVAALLPQLQASTAPPQIWCGLRPATPSGIPFVGAGGWRGLWLNTGHGPLGWTLACGSAHRLCRQMLGEAAA